MSYVAQGFIVSTQTNDTTTLFKKKEFNVLWAVIGFFLCLLPLLIYCIIYATQKDEMVVIRVGHIAVGNGAPAALQEASRQGVESLTWSEDRKYWWNGKTWINAQNTVPPGAHRTDDGELWWDGESWRPVPSTAAGKDVDATVTESPETDANVDAAQRNASPDTQDR